MPDEPAWVGENGDELPSKLKELLHVPREVARVDNQYEDFSLLFLCALGALCGFTPGFESFTRRPHHNSVLWIQSAGCDILVKLRRLK